MFRGVLARTLENDLVLRALAPLRRGDGAILVLHRFAHPDRRNHGVPVAALRTQLAWLRRHRVPLLPLSELLDPLHGAAGRRAGGVAFTVDDGYADFYEAALPVFAEFDCPVTVFLVTGFLDGTEWLWWDRLKHAVLHAPVPRITLPVGEREVTLDLGDAAARRMMGQRLVDAWERIPDGEMRSAIDGLYRAVGMAQPTVPPDEYAPMTWDQVRVASSRGVTFGPHTVTHPVLANVGDDCAAHEIGESWRRLRFELPDALPIFAYPNGSAWAFGPRDVAAAREAGLRAALTTRPAYAAAAKTVGAAAGPYTVPRFYADADPLRLMQVVSGVAATRMWWRAVRHRGALSDW